MTTNFLYAAGTNGLLIASPLDLMTTELNSLANGAAATSSVGGSSGKFSQTDTGKGILTELWYNNGQSITPTAGAFLAAWFLRSWDGGTTFEDLISTPSATVPALPRAPDFTIPIYEGGAAIASSKRKMAQGSGRIILPAVTFKLVIQNMSGVALGATGNKITLGPVAVQI